MQYIHNGTPSPHARSGVMFFDAYNVALSFPTPAFLTAANFNTLSVRAGVRGSRTPQPCERARPAQVQIATIFTDGNVSDTENLVSPRFSRTCGL
jgi:hypothetical protein